MKRGEIYYIQRRDTIGAETAKARPGIIVSNDALNVTSEVVMVVYLTTQPKKEMPTHVAIEATGLQSTAICEHIDHVSKMLVGAYCGACTEEEMNAIDAAMLSALGIECQEGITFTPNEWHLQVRLEKLQDERDRYAKMIDTLLGVIEQ